MIVKALNVLAITLCLFHGGYAVNGAVGVVDCDVKLQASELQSGDPINDAETRIVHYEEKKIFYESFDRPGIFELVPAGKVFISIYRNGFELEVIEENISCIKEGDKPQTISLKVKSIKLYPAKTARKAKTSSEPNGSQSDSTTDGKPLRITTIRGAPANGRFVIGEASKGVSAGVVNGKAVKLARPKYPSAARIVNARGSVSVAVIIDKIGNVVSAIAVSGHPLLTRESERAAVGSVFKPTLVEGQPVEVSGVIIYNYQ